MAIANTMRMGAEGIKIQISGRLNGAEMARSEMYKEGRTPLHTFRADIDYCHAEALTKVGLLGIKFGFVEVKFMVRRSWLRTLRKARKVVVEAIAETMAERTSKERKIIANEFDF